MLVQKLRLQRGWSQEQLATISGLSVRTIQRIERGQPPGLESLKTLAAIFEIDISELRSNPPEEQSMPMPMTPTTPTETEELLAFAKVRKLKGFYIHASIYFVVIPFLFINNWFTTGFDPVWAHWPTLGWGLGLALHAIVVFQPLPFLGPDWEKRQIEKELGRKL